jgi:hypothetical protein
MNPFGQQMADDEDKPSRKLTASQSALIDKAIAQEKVITRAIRDRAPLVETYTQFMKPDPDLGLIPDSDEHSLARVNFDKIVSGNGSDVVPPASTRNKLGFFKQPFSIITGLTHHQSTFIRMLLMDYTSFDRQHYSFVYVRNDFLGNTPTAVFAVTPFSKSDKDRFFGRIWVETRNGNVVRFTGDFTSVEQESPEHYRFDGWRTNVQPNLWLPTSLYVEESDPNGPSYVLKFKAISHAWGYVLKASPPKLQDPSLGVTTSKKAGKHAVDAASLEARRTRADMVEDAVIERLFQAGLLDAPSEFDKTLEDLVNNILVYNNITLPKPIRCRTLLTAPLESTAIGNTIIISKSLLDTTGVLTESGMQQMGNLNAVLAFQVAHIILAHRIDAKAAFNDSLLYPSSSVYKRIPLHHTAADNAAAARKALQLLNVKELAGGQQYFGLYLEQLQQRVKALKALNEPVIGDGLVKSDNDSTFWMAEMMTRGPRLEINNLQQRAAMPLSSFLRFDPWTDQLMVMHTAYEPLLTPADKMPFEVEPIYFKLSYYVPAKTPAVAP